MGKLVGIKREPEWLPKQQLTLPEHYRLTPERAEWLKETRKVDLPLAERGEDGYFIIPSAGKQEGARYVVYAMTDETWSSVSIQCLDEQRSLSGMELAYIRNMFFAQDVVVLNYIPKQETCAKLAPHIFLQTTLYAPNDKVIRVPPKAKI